MMLLYLMELLLHLFKEYSNLNLKRKPQMGSLAEEQFEISFHIPEMVFPENLYSFFKGYGFSVTSLYIHPW